MYDYLLKLVKKQGYKVDSEVELMLEQFVEVLEGKNGDDDLAPLLAWLEVKRENYKINTQEVGINELEKWHVDPNTGNIYHESGRFYTVTGVKVSGAVEREVTSWTQPMIKQQECGILGILCQKKDDTRYYLLQAKYEPGNTAKLQLSPTLQATESNLKQAHKGKKPLFAEYFEEGGKGKVLVSVVGVEDGGRFYMKTNRSMLVEIDENEVLDVPENFIWVNLYQLKRLMKIDLVANSLTRSVIGSF